MIDDAESGSPDGRTHRIEHDGEGSVASTIALAVADIDGVDVTAMEPLHGAVEPALLEAIERAGNGVTADVMFTYRGYRVRVDSDGAIVITPAATHE